MPNPTTTHQPAQKNAVTKRGSPSRRAVELCQCVHPEATYNVKVYEAILGIPRDPAMAFEARLRLKHRNKITLTGETITAKGRVLDEVLNELDTKK